MAAALSPMFALLTRRYVPDVVWLLAFGVLLGPNVMDLAQQTDAVDFIRELGKGFLFLLAGFEVRPNDMRGRQGRHAALTWFVSAALALGAGLLLAHGQWPVAIVFALVSTTTALGTLLPILKNSGVLGTPLGRATMVHGTFGELLPIPAMSLLLSAHDPGVSALLLLFFFVAAVIIVTVPARVFHRIPFLRRALVAASDTTMQTTLRLSVFALVSLMLLTAVLDPDVALGAFTAGLLLSAVLSGINTEQADSVAHKVEVVGFSFLIPVFFVTSGMDIDLAAVLILWPVVLGFVAIIAVVHGLVIFVHERYVRTGSGLRDARHQAALGLYSATGLPMIVAVTQVAKGADIVSQDTASVMVTGGAVTVLLFPLVARLLVKWSAPVEIVDTA